MVSEFVKNGMVMFCTHVCVDLANDLTTYETKDGVREREEKQTRELQPSDGGARWWGGGGRRRRRGGA